MARHLIFESSIGSFAQQENLILNRLLKNVRRYCPAKITVLDFDTVVSEPQTILKIIAATLNLGVPGFPGHLPRLKQSAGDLMIMAMRLHNSRSTGKVFLRFLITICRIIDRGTLKKIRIFIQLYPMPRNQGFLVRRLYNS